MSARIAPATTPQDQQPGITVRCVDCPHITGKWGPTVNKLTWYLFSAIFGIVLSGAAILGSIVLANSERVAVVETRQEEMRRVLDQIDNKVDRLLEANRRDRPTN